MFKVDKFKLGDTKFDNFLILWYDEAVQTWKGHDKLEHNCNLSHILNEVNQMKNILSYWDISLGLITIILGSIKRYKLFIYRKKEIMIYSKNQMANGNFLLVPNLNWKALKTLYVIVCSQ